MYALGVKNESDRMLTGLTIRVVEVFPPPANSHVLRAPLFCGGSSTFNLRPREPQLLNVLLYARRTHGGEQLRLLARGEEYALDHSVKSHSVLLEIYGDTFSSFQRVLDITVGEDGCELSLK